METPAAFQRETAPPPTERSEPSERSDLDAFLPQVYDHLRALAGRLLRGHGGFTLQPTGLVHEAYLRLLGQRLLSWQDKDHFFLIAAKVMRRALVDHCRSRAAHKRGGGEVRTTLSGLELAAPDVEVDVLAVDRILMHLETLDPMQVRIVELRFFAGLTVEETAAALGVSRSTVKREWILARASILFDLEGGQGQNGHGS
jgi:RNA polymerase sigma-70 factor, ECF subfamily